MDAKNPTDARTPEAEPVKDGKLAAKPLEPAISDAELSARVSEGLRKFAIQCATCPRLFSSDEGIEVEDI